MPARDARGPVAAFGSVSLANRQSGRDRTLGEQLVVPHRIRLYGCFRRSRYMLVAYGGIALVLAAIRTVMSPA